MSLPRGFSQDLRDFNNQFGDGSSGRRGGGAGSDDIIKNSNKINNTAINFHGLQFIINRDGQSLNLQINNETKLVTSSPLHGGNNQQWLVEDDGNGNITLKSRYNTYVAPEGSNQGAALFSTDAPFYWDILKDEEGYKLAVPNSHFALSLENSPALLPLSHQDTRLYIVENTPENEAMIKSGRIVPSSPTTPSPSNERFNNGTNITFNVTISGISGSGNAINALSDLRNLFGTVDGVKNLVICLGHHQTTSISNNAPPSDSRTKQVTIGRPKKVVFSEMAPVPTTSPGTANIIGFGLSGVVIAPSSNGVHPMKHFVLADFAERVQGWRVDQHPRLLADTTGNGKADIVGFGFGGVWVSLNNCDNTFRAPKMVLSNFAYGTGGWSVEKHLRFMADITGNGRADIVGFGDPGVFVALNHGDGSFGPNRLVVNTFGYISGAWRLDKHPRFLADVTGNGLVDIIGFGDSRVYISYNNGDGTFQPITNSIPNLCYDHGWRVDKHPRFLADLTGDGKADLIGFGEDGVYAAFNNGDGTFKPVRQVFDDFCYAKGWRIEKHPRFIADLTGDGCGDIIGFGEDGAYIAINNGNGTFLSKKLIPNLLSYNSGWRVEDHPRYLVDMTGDGRADIVGFGSRAVWVSYNDGNGNFGQANELCRGFGSDDEEWATGKSLKYVANI